MPKNKITFSEERTRKKVLEKIFTKLTILAGLLILLQNSVTRATKKHFFVNFTAFYLTKINKIQTKFSKTLYFCLEDFDEKTYSRQASAKRALIYNLVKGCCYG